MNRVCIDFLGVPGCGKSTIAHLLAEKLSCHGIVEEPTYTLAHQTSSGIKLLMKVRGCFSLMLCHPSIFRRLMTIVRESGYHYYSGIFYKHLYNLAFKIVEIKGMKCNYLLFDEGLWQSAVSLYYNRPCTIKDIVDLHSKLMSLAFCEKDEIVDYISVFVDVDIKEAIQRQQNRKAKPSRVQSLDKKERDKELSKQKAIFEQVKANIVINSTDVCPRDNAQILFLKLANNEQNPVFGK